MKDVLVIVNPASGNGHTGRSWHRIAAELRGAGLDFDSALTDRPAQATDLAREAVREGRPTVVAAGGDGTINEVAAGFFEGGDPLSTASRLGVVPLGTGGDFRRTFAIPKDLGAAARALREGRQRTIDAGRATYRLPDGGGGDEVGYFVNIADVGIGGEVVRQVKSGPRLLNGEVTFTVATALALLRWRNRPMRVVVDGAERELVAQQVVIANCQYYGGGMRVAPRAEPDDGRFDVLLVGDLTLAECLRMAGPMRRGVHLDQPMAKVEYCRARRVEIASPASTLVGLDGELPGVLPATFEILPGALQLVVP